MPGMNGLELVRGLHEQGPVPPVVLVSASPYLGGAVRQAGVVGVLVKPFRLEVLRAIVRAVLGGHSGGPALPGGCLG